MRYIATQHVDRLRLFIIEAKNNVLDAKHGVRSELVGDERFKCVLNHTIILSAFSLSLVPGTAVIYDLPCHPRHYDNPAAPQG